jgi:hypothetical protein
MEKKKSKTAKPLLNMRINVKANNVDRACTNNSHCCMIADAIRDRLNWATFIEVDTQTIRFNDRKKGIRYIYLTPPEAQKAIVLFDQGVKVPPFAFSLRQAFLQTKIMRARQKKAVKRSSEYTTRATRGKNPAKRTPAFVRQFGLRGIARQLDS